MIARSALVLLPPWLQACRDAVSKFFDLHNTKVEPIMVPHQRSGSYFQKKEHFELDMEWYAKYNATRTEELKKDHT